MLARTGFLEHARRDPPKRPVHERVNDYREVYLPLPVNTLQDTGAIGPIQGDYAEPGQFFNGMPVMHDLADAVLRGASVVSAVQKL